MTHVQPQRSDDQQSREWSDGFLFVANRPILDLLNTKPVLAQGPTANFSPDFHAVERWFIASGIVHSAKTKRFLRSWRDTAAAEDFLKNLIAFRERLREAVLRIEAGSTPSDEFIKDVNARLRQHPSQAFLGKTEGRIVWKSGFDPQEPADLWVPTLRARWPAF